MTDCTQTALERRRRQGRLGSGNAITCMLYERNRPQWRDPHVSGGRPAVLSESQRQWGYVGDGGTLWVVVRRILDNGSQDYSLTYCLRKCEPYVADGPSSKKFGCCGTRGDPTASQWFPFRDMSDQLMALRFVSGNAIQSRAVIAKRLRGTRPLCDEDVDMLTKYVQGLGGSVGIFISYAREDFARAEIVKTALESHGHSVFLDQYAIIAGRPWKEALEDAVERAKVFVVLCSDAASKPNCWVNNEVDWALKRTRQRNGRKLSVLPILLPRARRAPWRRLARFQRLEWDQPSPDEFLGRLLAGVSTDQAQRSAAPSRSRVQGD